MHSHSSHPYSVASLGCCISRVFNLSLVILLGMILTGCGGEGDSGGDSTSPKVSKSMPKYDKGATYNGRTVDEYAAGLSDLNPQVRLQALRNIAQFGVNGLAVREQVKKIVLEDAEHSLRVAALGGLVHMQDPKAGDLYVEVLGNPQFTDNDQIWYELARGARESLPGDRLEKELKKIANNNQEHAERLLNLRTKTEMHLPLSKVLMDKKVSGRSMNVIMSYLPRMEISDKEKIDFIKNNIDSLPNKTAAMQAIAAIPGELALETTLSMIREDSSIPLTDALNVLYSKSSEDMPRIMAFMADLSEESGRSQQELQQIYQRMSSVIDQRKGRAAQGQVDPYVEAVNVYFSELGELTKNDSPDVRSVSAMYILNRFSKFDFVMNFSYFETFDFEAFLQPLFVILENDSEEIVLGTVLSQFENSIARFQIDPNWQENKPKGINKYDWLEKKIADAIYARNSDDKWAYAIADGLLKTADNGMLQSRLFWASMIPLVFEKAKANSGHIANARVFDWLIAITFKRNLGQLLGSQANADKMFATLGDLAMDPVVSQAQVETLFGNREFAARAISFSGDNVDTIIGILNPIAMSQDAKFTGPTALANMKTVLSSNIYYMRGKPDQAKYIDWVRQVAAKGHPAFRSIAAAGLQQYAN